MLLKNRLEGVGRFAHEVLSRLVQLMPEHQFTFVFDRAFDQDFIYAPNVKGIVVFPQARHPLLYQWWFEYSIPAKLKSLKADLFFSPEGYLSLRSTLPSINVIHDINFEHHPEMLDRAHRWHFKKYFPKYARKAQKIVTVSEFSKADISKTYTISSDKIDVIYNGVSDQFKALSEEQQEKVRGKWTQGNPYFIFVGSIHPRKNLARLLRSFELFKEKDKNNFQLVIVGKRAFLNKEMDDTLAQMKYKDSVLFTGRLEEEEMIQVLASAHALTFVPVFEGFGMPIIEAFKCEVPVICSNTTSLPEIAGTAALFVDPSDENDISAALQKLSTDQELRQSLRVKGTSRAKEFSWDTAAERVMELIKKELA